MVTGYASEGKALAKVDGKVIFIEGAVPGDTVDVFVSTNKKIGGKEGLPKFMSLLKKGYNLSAGTLVLVAAAKWQMLPYEKQLEYKQQEAEQNFKRIGKVDLPPLMPIVGSNAIKYYRNKLSLL